ncbi:CAP domain-containing protein [uncultured Phenylobacterium sp.]|uniref:CAP domain-containing protein n=1 Tax=uncultured Phenylobacterium sp. TaxID=349273 RepID=UPI0025DE0DB6|nr:CAP domain-containing protein [uncultured Phenylobacterium sp.]
MSLTRRATLAAGLATAASASAAPQVTVVLAQDEAPPASDIEAWSSYEARLRARLADGGGGRFDDDGARAALVFANRARAAAGAGPLTWHDELAQSARAHGGDLARRGTVEHLSPEGFDPSHRLWLIGRTTIGSPSENLAYHHRAGPPATPARLVEQWRKSPDGHWQNLLRETHTHAAFALLRGRDQALLVGLFLRPVAALAEPLPFLAKGDEIAQAIRGIDPDLSPRLGAPQGVRRGVGATARRVMQISAVRRGPGGQPDYIGGPVFLPTR